MIYEVVNPSDAVSIEADDSVVASAATILVGTGKYFLSAADGSKVDMPMMLFAKDPSALLQSWCEQVGFKDFDALMGKHIEAVATCLESSLVGDVSDRAGLLEVFEKVGDKGSIAEAMDAWNDKKRSSMNDICGRARSIARGLRKTIAEAKTG